MPELPEVEVVRQTLNQNLSGLTITRIECFYPSIIDDMEDFISKVVHHKIVSVDRYAKYLIFILDEGAFLSHLRMEGKYFYVDKDYEIVKHQHVIFYLDNGYRLIYQDVRKFGRMTYKAKEMLFQTPPLSLLGPEANDSTIDVDTLYEKLKKKSLPIKTVLLDQSFISGLGNIYADEVLYEAKISPLRIAKQIKKEELQSILVAANHILTNAIHQKGTTIRSYTSSLGVKGEYQKYLAVHTKSCCLQCQQALTIIKIGGRSSYYCKNCQRES